MIYLLEPFIPLEEIKHTPKHRNFNPSLRKLRSSKLDLIRTKHQERLLLIYNQYILQHERLPPSMRFDLLVKCAPDIPHQSNSHDCGVFLLEFMKYIAHEKPFNFSCMDMPYFRDEIKTEIQNQEIKGILESPAVQISTKSGATLEGKEKKTPFIPNLADSNVPPTRKKIKKKQESPQMTAKF